MRPFFYEFYTTQLNLNPGPCSFSYQQLFDIHMPFYRNINTVLHNRPKFKSLQSDYKLTP